MAASAGDVLGLPYLIYGQRARIMFPLLDADGDLVTGAATPDSEISKDQGTFADCTNEMTEIATSSGVYYLDLIQSETQASSIAVIAKSATAGMKTTPMVFPIRRLPVLRSGTAQAGASNTITLDSGASAKDDFYNGMIIQCANNSPANVQGQTRFIIDYVGSTKVATVAANWGTNPSSATTFEIYVPETANAAAFLYKEFADPTTNGVPEVDMTHVAGSTVSTSSAQIGVNVVNAGGTAWGSGAITAGSIAADAITAAKIADNAIDAGAIAADAITAAKIADGAIDAATFAAGAINNAACSFDGSELTAIPWNASWDAEVQSEVEDGIVAKNLDTEVSAIKTKTDQLTFTTANQVDCQPISIAASAITATSIATDAITAAKIAADAITSSELAASAVTEIQSGLSTLDAAGVRSAVGLASANLDTQLTAIDDAVDTEVASVLAAVDTEVAAIKAKTDQLTFTVASQLDANVQSINDVTITGDGQVGTEFGV